MYRNSSWITSPRSTHSALTFSEKQTLLTKSFHPKVLSLDPYHADPIVFKGLAM